MSVLKELKMIHLMVKQQFRIQRILCILNMNFSDLNICFWYISIHPTIHSLPLIHYFNFSGTPGAGHTDKLGRLKELCDQYNMWLHVEGWVAPVNL